KETGTILYEKEAHTPREPASVTKVMTLLLIMEAVDAGLTAAGVTAGIDLGLYLCAMLYNKDIMFKIAKQMEYSLPENFEEELF
ncbi:MAG: hypothetical protein II220_05665, partial [Spirochaetales bacterium]|nr:hypothetical protein [Spirochaetales bacterium]